MVSLLQSDVNSIISNDLEWQKYYTILKNRIDGFRISGRDIPNFKEESESLIMHSYEIRNLIIKGEDDVKFYSYRYPFNISGKLRLRKNSIDKAIDKLNTFVERYIKIFGPLDEEFKSYTNHFQNGLISVSKLLDSTLYLFDSNDYYFDPFKQFKSIAHGVDGILEYVSDFFPIYFLCEDISVDRIEILYQDGISVLDILENQIYEILSSFEKRKIEFEELYKINDNLRIICEYINTINLAILDKIKSNRMKIKNLYSLIEIQEIFTELDDWYENSYTKKDREKFEKLMENLGI